MSYQIFNTLFYVSMGVILIPIFLLLTNHNSQPPAYKWLTVLLVFSFLCDFINELHLQFQLGFPQNFFPNTYSLLNPLLLSCFFYAALDWKWLKIPFIVVNIAYLIFAVYNFIFLQKTTINTYSQILDKLLIMIFSIMYFYKVIKELPAEKIYQIGLFCIIAAMFVINSAKLVLYSFAHYLIIFNDNLVLLFSIHNLMSIVCSIAVAYGIIVHLKHSSSAQTRPISK